MALSERVLGLVALGFVDACEFLAQVAIEITALSGFTLPLVLTVVDFGQWAHGTGSVPKMPGEDRAQTG